MLIHIPIVYGMKKGGSRHPLSWLCAARPVSGDEVVDVPPFVGFALQPGDVLIVTSERHHLLTSRSICCVLLPHVLLFVLLFILHFSMHLLRVVRNFYGFVNS